MKNYRLIFSIFAVVISSYALCQTSALYVTAGQSGQDAILQGGVATVYNQAVGYEYPIAVSNSSVRTAGSGQFTAATEGAGYNMAFADTGTRYNQFTYNSAQNYLFYDGASDGIHNYVVNYGYLGGVYQTGLDWSNQTLLFNLGGFGTNLGITYDTTNNSLWVSNYFGGTTINDYSMSGALLSSFSTNISSMDSLALDPADNTIWFSSTNKEGTFYQYSKSGTFLQSITYKNMLNLNSLGAEFNVQAVPEPAPVLVIGLGLLGLVISRRRA